MLDIQWVREHGAEAREALEGRGAPEVKETLEEVLSLDTQRREILKGLEERRARLNRESQEIGRAKTAGDARGAGERMAGLEEVKSEIKSAEKKLRGIEALLEEAAFLLPNLPLPGVPRGRSAEENRVVRERPAGKPAASSPRPHWEVGEDLGILDFSSAARMSGSRFTVLRGAGPAVERALISFMLDLHTREHGYEEIWTPVMVKADALRGTGQLPKFAEEVYRCSSGEPGAAPDDLYLIPTAEVTLTHLHQGETLDGGTLPRRYVAYTPCFRREAGSYGKDTKGLIRNHQFDKVELVSFCRPDQSEAELERLTGHAETVLAKLGLAYRVVELCTGDLGFAAARTYDLEVWMPGEKRWREISSCSTFTDFQARRLDIRHRVDGKNAGLVHTLNGSGVAVGRALAAVLEQYQQSDGSVVVPDVLRPHLGQERIRKRGGGDG